MTAATDSASESKLYFCLDCERCPSSHCSHYKHTRRLIDNRAQHVTSYAHGRFQAINLFLPKDVKVKLNDLAYDKDHGKNVRKQYKKYAASVCPTDPHSAPNLFDYKKIKQCKSCTFQTMSIVYMFPQHQYR